MQGRVKGMSCTCVFWLLRDYHNPAWISVTPLLIVSLWSELFNFTLCHSNIVGIDLDDTMKKEIIILSHISRLSNLATLIKSLLAAFSVLQQLLLWSAATVPICCTSSAKDATISVLSELSQKFRSMLSFLKTNNAFLWHIHLEKVN